MASRASVDRRAVHRPGLRCGSPHSHSVALQVGHVLASLTGTMSVRILSHLVVHSLGSIDLLHLALSTYNHCNTPLQHTHTIPPLLSSCSSLLRSGFELYIVLYHWGSISSRCRVCSSFCILRDVVCLYSCRRPGVSVWRTST
jgi:hypothetical protein